MRKLIFLLLVLFVAVPAFAHDVNIAVTKSLDDPTPRSSVFPASMSPVFKHYLVEQNGVVLPQTCLPGCTNLTVTGLADGTYSYRLGAVVEITRSDNTKVFTTGWSTVKSITINCGTPTPDEPELGAASQVCK